MKYYLIEKATDNMLKAVTNSKIPKEGEKLTLGNLFYRVEQVKEIASIFGVIYNVYLEEIK